MSGTTRNARRIWSSTGVDFAEVARFDFAGAIAEVEERGGVRYVAQATSALNKLVYVVRDGNIRVVSLRKANDRERRAYHERKG